ncbi:MAG: isoamylase early set domain-containing protein [Nitrospira sp.]|nr:isoamylase early set domain-containing protein [Nitrospira sp.]MDH4250530.1 isoamylase early set domain-containing protein [Nitrospira sp.]
MFHVIILLSITMALSGTWSCTKTVTPEPPKTTPGGVRFTVLAPGAKNVFLVGSFNGWAKRATPMKIMDGTLWSVVVPLEEGEYPFMYVIDGVRWVTPPQADDFVTDGFGQTNGVVVVR